jgi:predicted DNA-binding transcriptional regulator YafY
MPDRDAASDAMNANERIGKLFLLFLKYPRGLSFADVRSLMSEAYRGDEEANRKKFQRDREALRTLGLHLELDSAGAAGNESDRVYVVAATARPLMGELKLSATQRSYVMGLILRHMNKIGKNNDEYDLCQSLYMKLFYRDTDQSIEVVDSRSEINPLYSRDRSIPEDILSTLQDAMLQRRKIRMVYEGMTEKKERIVHPLALNIYRRMWYLTAYCETAGDYRIFQVDLIRSPQIDRGFTSAHPPEIIQYLKPHPLNLKREPLKRIRLRLNPDYINRFDHFVAELPPDNKIKSGRNHREIVTSNPEALFYWMFRHPGAVEAMGSSAMRERFLEFLKTIEDRNHTENPE